MKEPLKLIPLEQFGKLVEAIARVPKDALDKAEADLGKRRPKPKD